MATDALSPSHEANSVCIVSVSRLPAVPILVEIKLV